MYIGMELFNFRRFGAFLSSVCGRGRLAGFVVALVFLFAAGCADGGAGCGDAGGDCVNVVVADSDARGGDGFYGGSSDGEASNGKAANGEAPPLRVVFLDVGQGLAVLLEWAGKFALYDTGPDSVGVVDSLLARGVDTLEWVVLSHNHRDHAGGFMEIGGRTGVDGAVSHIGTALIGTAPRVQVRRLYVGPDTASGFVRDSVLRLARRYGIPVDTLVRGMALAIDEAGTALFNKTVSLDKTAPRFQVLWPPEYVRVGENGASVVLRAEYGAGSMLLPGDLDSVGERRLLELSPTLEADLMQVGHHGSAGSSSLQFVAQVAPRYAVVSVGEANDYGHPTQSTVRKFEYVLGDSARFFRTDLDGSVEFELHKNLGIILP